MARDVDPLARLRERIRHKKIVRTDVPPALAIVSTLGDYKRVIEEERQNFARFTALAHASGMDVADLRRPRDAQ